MEKGKKVNIPRFLGKEIEKKLTDDEFRNVVRLAKLGHRESINELIRCHIGLIFALVARYNKTFVKNTDELVGIALLALVHAVDRIVNGHCEHDNVSGYIVTFVHGDLRRYFRKIPTKGTELCEDVADTTPIQSMLEVDEEINWLSRDETDKTILKMLFQGYKATEIADYLGVNKSNVSRRIFSFRKRELENGHQERTRNLRRNS